MTCLSQPVSKQTVKHYGLQADGHLYARYYISNKIRCKQVYGMVCRARGQSFRLCDLDQVFNQVLAHDGRAACRKGDGPPQT